MQQWHSAIIEKKISHVGGLAFDEMKLEEGLVIEPRNNMVIGYADYGVENNSPVVHMLPAEDRMWFIFATFFIFLMFL